jgi:hypothetical protein
LSRTTKGAKVEWAALNYKEDLIQVLGTALLNPRPVLSLLYDKKAVLYLQMQLWLLILKKWDKIKTFLNFKNFLFILRIFMVRVRNFAKFFVSF